MAERKPRKTSTARALQVIVDFIFEDGLFFIAIENIGERPAYRVAIKFDRPIVGSPEHIVISDLPLFRNIEFLAPRKKITTFVDTSTAYFQNNPARISATISHIDERGKRHKATIVHDLSIYKDIGYIERHSPTQSVATNKTR
jgi:hypothetical protein